MNVQIEPGRYIVAVSGGVDSMVLLHLLLRQQDIDVVVAHYDHGMRHDSYKDRELVEGQAKRYGLPFRFEEGQLGDKAGEQTARENRYDFLMRLRAEYLADAVLTAHHQDDLIETAFLNLLRGTRRKGLTALLDNNTVRRPLTAYAKDEIVRYAKDNKIEWREDQTNTDTKFARNYIRANIMPKLSPDQRSAIIGLLLGLSVSNRIIDLEIAKYLQSDTAGVHQLEKLKIVMLPHAVACEAVALWLRENGIRDFDKNLIERLVIAIKTYRPHQKADVSGGRYVLVGNKHIELNSKPRFRLHIPASGLQTS